MDDLLNHFSPIIKNWIGLMIQGRMIHRLDKDQIWNNILLDLNNRLKSTDWKKMEYLSVKRICRAIAFHNVINAEVFERALKRNRPSSGRCRTSPEFVADHHAGCNPEYKLDNEDFFDMIRRRLPSKYRHICEMVLLGCDNKQIAATVGISIRTIQKMTEFIRTIVGSELRKMEIPFDRRNSITAPDQQPITNS